MKIKVIAYDNDSVFYEWVSQETDYTHWDLSKYLVTTIIWCFYRPSKTDIWNPECRNGKRYLELGDVTVRAELVEA